MIIREAFASLFNRFNEVLVGFGQVSRCRFEGASFFVEGAKSGLNPV